MNINETHSRELKSWVGTANEDGTDFPIQNLPFGVFHPTGDGDRSRVGIAIGDQVLDMRRASKTDLFAGPSARAARACVGTSLNDLMSMERSDWTALRMRLSEILREGFGRQEQVAACLVPMSDVEMEVPAEIGDYTDFYASVFHATNVGSMFRPDNPLLPNYKHVPIAYHGRASSIVPSGTPVRRPKGQTKPDDADAPAYGPSRLLDYELEMGVFVGYGNDHGDTVPMERATDYLFGMCIVNDWSARDIQKWEYQPLGPFLAKSFATTVSPWIVTMEALAPFRVGAFERPEGDPDPLPYLSSDADREHGGLDITVEVFLRSERMRAGNETPVRLSRGNFRDMYWTVAQMLVHHAGNGCNLRPGDLLASGTVSGESEDARGCLLELTWRGQKPIVLPGGDERRFLQDGDEVTITAYCENENARRIGFGPCNGVVAPAEP